MILAKYLEQKSKEICADNKCTDDDHNCESYAYIDQDGNLLDLCCPDYFQGSSKPHAAVALPWTGTQAELMQEIEDQIEANLLDLNPEGTANDDAPARRQASDREVTDILDAGMGPVAFIQHQESGALHYEAVCPWCALTLAQRISPDPIEYGELYRALIAIQTPHMLACENKSATSMKAFCFKRD